VPSAIYNVMEGIKACVQAELARRDLEPVGYAMIQAGGTPVIDHVGNGGNCGELVVNLASAYSSVDFPNPDPEGRCGSEKAYVINVAIFRCAAVPTGTAMAPIMPTVAAMEASAQQVDADMMAIEAGIKCCLVEGDDPRLYVLGDYTPYGPAGAAVGGYWRVTVGPVN
jgi:hypothetical protein